MKKLIIASFVAALFAACNNTPAVNESAVKVGMLTTWVDSVKNVIATSTTHDSVTWASYNATYTDVYSSIKMDELDEANKTQLAATANSWTEAGANYTNMMNSEKDAAKMQSDSTMAKTTEGVEKK